MNTFNNTILVVTQVKTSNIGFKLIYGSEQFSGIWEDKYFAYFKKYVSRFWKFNIILKLQHNVARLDNNI